MPGRRQSVNEAEWNALDALDRQILTGLELRLSFRVLAAVLPCSPEESQRRLQGLVVRGLLDESSVQAAAAKGVSEPSALEQDELKRRLGEASELLTSLDTLSHYGLLGVHGQASHDELVRAFLGKLGRFHPEALLAPVTTGQRTRLEMLCNAFMVAYEVLGSPSSRAAYDEALGAVGKTDEGRSSAVYVKSSAREEAAPASVRPSPPAGPPQARAQAPVARAPAAPAPTPSGHSAGQALLRALQARRGSMPRTPSRPDEQVSRSALEALANELASGDGLAQWAAAHVRRADREERAGDCQAAITTLQTAMAKCSDLRIREQRDRLKAPIVRALAEDLRKRAMEAEQGNRHKDAAEHWRKVLDLEPQDRNAALHAASCLMQAGDARQAGQYAKRAAELDPGDVQAHKLLLRCYETLGMTQSAARERETLETLQRRR